jgi:hypothetical protein
MNGNLVHDKTEEGLLNAANLISGLATNDRVAVESAYLAVLTRRPTPEEDSFFTGKLAGLHGDARSRRLRDLFWTLINSEEFSWNH